MILFLVDTIVVILLLFDQVKFNYLIYKMTVRSYT
jgi:hypothetical protein